MENVFGIKSPNCLGISVLSSAKGLKQLRQAYIRRHVRSSGTNPSSVIRSSLPALSACHTLALYDSQPSTQRRPFESHSSRLSCILHRQCPSRPCFRRICTTLPSPPSAKTSSYMICRISNGSFVRNEDISWSSVRCLDLRILYDMLLTASRAGRGFVRARFRFRGRGTGASKGDSPRARRASS